MRISLKILLILAWLTCVGFAETVVYTSLSAENAIAIHRLDEKTGELSLIETINAETSPGSLTTSRDHRFLYASLCGNSSVGVYAIDLESGNLSYVKTTQLPGKATYLFVDNSNQFLLSAYYSEGRVAVNRIAEDGSILGNDLQVIDNGLKAHSIQTDGTNRFVFCPHTGEVNKIDEYLFNPETGRLSPNNPPSISPTEEKTGPRHFQFHPDGEWVYFVNEQGSSITTYSLDQKRGALTPLETVSTLPKDFEGQNSCADIEIHPAGKFLYASNRGHDSIACYAIDPEGGALISLGQVTTEATPRSFDIEPAGQFLIVAGQKSGNHVVYRINQETGKLKALKTSPAGKGPSWVEAVRLNDQ